MNKTLLFFPLLFILTLGGCASLSKKECQNADWYLIGLEDGSQGRSLATLGNHRKACARVDIAPDLPQYQAGHREGLRTYCTPHRGYRLGVSGGAYQTQCPPDLEPQFRQSYQAGRELRQTQTRLAGVNTRLQDHYTELRRTEEQIIELEEAIVGDASTGAERREHLAHIRELRENIPILQEEIEMLEQDRAHAETEHQALVNYHRELGY